MSVELSTKLFAPEIAIAPENGSFESAPIVVIGVVAPVGTPVPAELVAITLKMWLTPTASVRIERKVEVLTPSTNVVHVVPEFVEY